MLELLRSPGMESAIVTATAMAVACALLSVVVVVRRWAFIGEGISHAGFGGIGTAWVLSLAVPALGNEGAVYAIAIVFCLAMAVFIGYFSHGSRVTTDSAIGIFLVASLAWGFLALAIYQKHRPEVAGLNWEDYLFGQIRLVYPTMMVAGLAVCAVVVAILVLLKREILCYAFDPEMALVSGVRAGFIHYLLMVLLALVLVVGMRLAGNLLVTAMLILPGATALLLSRRLGVVVAIAIACALVGAVGGLLSAAKFMPGLPTGPAMVLIMFAEFLIAYAWVKVKP